MALVINDNNKVWYMGNVPYEIDDLTISPGSDEQTLLTRAIQVINNGPRLRLIPRSGESSYVKFLRIVVPGETASATSTSVGKQGGMQLIHINNTLNRQISNEFRIVHEILHAIGFFHEHQRNDRNERVRINWSNIDAIYVSNFQIENKRRIGDYDYDSLMHYGRNAFSWPILNLETITPIDNNGDPTNQIIGQRDRISVGDTTAIRELYTNAGFRKISNEISINSDLAIGKNADGRLEVFCYGTDMRLWHLWQTNSTEWSGWTSFGGTFVGSPAVGQNQDGRLEVFCRSIASELLHRWQSAPNGDWVNEWHGLGQIFSDPVVSRTQNGRLEVYGRGTNTFLGHTWQNVANGSWHDWRRFSKRNSIPFFPDESIPFFGKPAVAMNHGGWLELFYKGPSANSTDIVLYHIWMDGANGGWIREPRSLGGNWPGSSNPAVGINADGRLEVFIIGTDDRLYHRWQTSPGGGWNSGWQRLGESVIGTPTIEQNQDGRLEVFVRDKDNLLRHTWQSPSGWSPLVPLGGPISKNPVVRKNSAECITAFVSGTDNKLYVRKQIAPNGTWEKE